MNLWRFSPFWSISRLD